MKQKLAALFVMVAMALCVLPMAAFAEGTVRVNNFDEFKTALSNPDCTAIELAGNITLTSDVTDPVSKKITVAADSNITLDLNGHVLNTSKMIQVKNATLTITGAAEGSLLSGSSNPVVEAHSTGHVILMSGTIQGTSHSVVRVQSGTGSFSMQGGTIRQAGGDYGVMANLGQVTISGGRIEGTDSKGLYLSSSAAATVGTDGSSDHTTPYVQSLYMSNNNFSGITLYSGTIVNVTGGSFAEGTVLTCRFGNDISNRLPGGLQCVDAGGGLWRVDKLQTAVATVDDVKYATMAQAIGAMKNGSTLKLLANCDEKVTLDNVYEAIIDLNGYNMNQGLVIGPKYGTASSTQNLVTVKNSGAAGAQIGGETPLIVSSGDSEKYISVSIEDTVTLSPASGGQAVALGTSARIAYTDKNAGYITNGGFKSTDANGNTYIYGTFFAAAEQAQDHTAVLLNNYTTNSNYIAVSKAGQFILDLGGHTFTVNGRSNGAAIQVQANDASLLVKNGKIVSDGDGAWVGVGPSNGHYSNVSLNLENVNLSTENSSADAYGIVSNGTSKNVNISIVGGSVSSSTSIGIYLPSDASTLLIDGAAVTGQTGVAIKGGTVTVKGDAKITGTGAYNAPQATNSGVTNTGDALYVEGNYNFPVTVNIQGGTFSSDHGNAVRMLKVSGATGDKVIAISGGSFSSDPSEYLADGYNVSGNASTGFEVGPAPAPTPKPEEPWTPGPTATPAPAQVLDSTPKTGAVSLAVLPLAGLAFAGLGFVTRKREE